MSQLLTISKKDPHFEKYLMGSFSETERAIPLQSLNVNSESEQVTFQIHKISEIKRPSIFLLSLNLFKVHNFIWVSLPLFLVLSKAFIENEAVDPLLSLFSTLGVLFIYSALSLRNDFQDHLLGRDRILPYRRGNVIQKGWVTANSLKKISHYLLVIGILCGLPAFWSFPLSIGLVGLSTLLSLLFFNHLQGRSKYFLFIESFQFFLFGPLLTLGYHISLGIDYDEEVLFLGFLSGFLYLFSVHIKNFKHILVLSSANFKNTMSFFGFEKSKLILLLWWISFCVFFLYYHYEYASSFITFVFLWYILISSHQIYLILSSLRSPGGSEIIRACRKLHYISLILMSLWIFENIWYILFFLKE